MLSSQTSSDLKCCEGNSSVALKNSIPKVPHSKRLDQFPGDPLIDMMDRHQWFCRASCAAHLPRVVRLKYDKFLYTRSTSGILSRFRLQFLSLESFPSPKQIGWKWYYLTDMGRYHERSWTHNQPSSANSQKRLALSMGCLFWRTSQLFPIQVSHIPQAL